MYLPTGLSPADFRTRYFPYTNQIFCLWCNVFGHLSPSSLRFCHELFFLPVHVLFWFTWKFIESSVREWIRILIIPGERFPPWPRRNLSSALPYKTSFGQYSCPCFTFLYFAVIQFMQVACNIRVTKQCSNTVLLQRAQRADIREATFVEC